MDKKMMKALIEINDVLDESHTKLSDKLKNLELSHNRMRNLLRMCLRAVENFNYGCAVDLAYLHKRLTLELYGLENYKGLKHE